MIYISKHYRQAILAVLLIILMSVGSTFYYYQNTGSLPGGEIALSKILWLGFIIFFWFIAPILLLINGTQTKTDQLLTSLHLSNVWLRGFIELFMMYQYQNWHPHYGITHDIISALTLVFLIIVFHGKLSNFIKYFFVIISITFAIEAFFAQYMLNNVADPSNPIFFVPDTKEHQSILISTWAMLLLLSVYLLFFIKKWCKTEHD